MPAASTASNVGAGGEAELTNLRVVDTDLDTGRMWVKIKKDGLRTISLLQGTNSAGFVPTYRLGETTCRGNFFQFLGRPDDPSERQLPYQGGRSLAGLGRVHPRTLRRTCCHVLADKGTDTPLLYALDGLLRHPAHRLLHQEKYQTFRKRLELGLRGRCIT